MDGTLTFLAALCGGICAGIVVYMLLQLVKDIQIDKTDDEEIEKLEYVRKLPLLFRIFLPMAPVVSGLAGSSAFDEMREKVRNMLLMAGYDQSMTPKQFMSIRILYAITGFLFGTLLILNGNSLSGLLVFGLLTIYPGAWLRTSVNRRHLEILKSLPNLLDLLTLSVEAGKDFLSALRDILARRKMDALGEEFTRALQEIQIGKKRQAALREMANRVQQAELSSVVNSIIQADDMGVSIGNLLKIQSDQLRAKRFSRAEKLANETPVKILGPVIVFIFPAVFIILLVPIFLRAAGVFS